MVGQFIYVTLLGDSGHLQNLNLTDIAARTIGWAAVGAFVGLGQGVAIRSTRKILQGLLGGVIGGAIGGFLFDFIGYAVAVVLGSANSDLSGAASRAGAIIVLGVCTGAAIGMVEELAKQAWLRITQGPMAGKEFILYHASTSIGSSPKCEITIPKDTAMLPQHCVIQTSGRGYSISSVDPRSPAFVNGRPAPQSALHDGDAIQLGQTILLYSERVAKDAGAAPYPTHPGGFGGK